MKNYEITYMYIAAPFQRRRTQKNSTDKWNAKYFYQIQFIHDVIFVGLFLFKVIAGTKKILKQEHWTSQMAEKAV